MMRPIRLPPPSLEQIEILEGGEKPGKHQMNNNTREFKFHGIYKWASVIEKNIEWKSSFGEIDWESRTILECLIKPCKMSLLHYYAFATISVSTSCNYRKNEDLLEPSSWDNEPLDEIEKSLRTYNVAFRPFSEYVAEEHPDYPNDGDFRFHAWFLSQEAAFLALWEKYTDEVFHMLFANRSFLLSFNKILSQYLQQHKDLIPKDFLSPSGHLKRASYIPRWLKKAVYHRDHGRCVLCQKDLTGHWRVADKLHFDHIVSLKQWGTNDACNFQLLCENCNWKKSSKPAETAYHYSAWWDY